MDPKNPRFDPRQVGDYAVHILRDFERNQLSLEDGLSVAASLISFILLTHNVSKETSLVVLADIKNMITNEVIKEINRRKSMNGKKKTGRLTLVPPNFSVH